MNLEIYNINRNVTRQFVLIVASLKPMHERNIFHDPQELVCKYTVLFFCDMFRLNEVKFYRKSTFMDFIGTPTQRLQSRHWLFEMSLRSPA